MSHLSTPLAIAAAALLALSACQTTDSDEQKESITWNTPTKAPEQTPPPSAKPPAPQASAQPEPECREYQTTITIGGKDEKAYGRACRQPDGTWKDTGVRTGKPQSKDPNAQAENLHPYGWHGYDYPYGPRYGPSGMSVGVGAGNRGGWFGYGVGF
jgi:hypothetical protein